ncbi:hypothetical protein VE02_00670 [Pseudogymnoascus sp. 03VT05]|nr:hypothetical protein VE02_00670 [Pseudogymnoascus sp. 03VT05]
MECIAGKNHNRKGAEMYLRRWWTINMCNLLTSFAEHLHQMADLRSFRVKVPIGSLTSERLDSLRCAATVSLISHFPKTLSSLTIDTPGGPSRFKPQMAESNHVCPLLLNKEILPSLRHLAIRSHSICPELCAVDDSKLQTQLQTLIVNLSMAEGGFYAAVNARYCEEDKYKGIPIYPHMKILAKSAAVHFPAIRTMRLLCINPKSPGSLEICYNVLSDREVLLPDDVHWDDMDWDDTDAEPAPPPSEHSDPDDPDIEASYDGSLSP